MFFILLKGYLGVHLCLKSVPYLLCKSDECSPNFQSIFLMCYSDLKESKSFSFSVHTSNFLVQIDEMFVSAYKNMKEFSVMSWLYGLLK